MEGPGENPILVLWERNQAQLGSVEAKIDRLGQLAQRGRTIPSGKLGALCFQQTRLRTRLTQLAQAITKSDL